MASPAMAYLELRGLSKTYGPTVAVADASLRVERGEAVALLGPSGCGKTTTLRMLAGLIAPTAGSILLDGQEITTLPAHRRNMGYVFQSYALFPHMDVASNVGFGLVERGLPRAERLEKVQAALALVRLTGLAERRPRELSGGQQQRVALARALVIAPSVLLLDESLSNLDAKLREDMRHEIREIQRKLAITTLFVTHDQSEALTMCDRIAVMDRGAVAQVGTPREIYRQPSSRFVAGFVGRANELLLSREGEGFSLGGVAVRLAPQAVLPADGEGLDLFIRPQHLHLQDPAAAAGGLNCLAGKVARLVYTGDRTDVLVDTAAGRLVVEIGDADVTPREDEAVVVAWRPEHGLVFTRSPA